MGAAVRIRAEVVGYPGRAVLRDIDLTIASGERIAVLGRSGVGKTTLLNLVFGQCRDEAALVPQGAALVGPLSVFHNVYMGRLDRHPAWYNLKTLAWPSRTEIARVRPVLDLVGLAGDMFRRAGDLSGGQQQRVSVARALFNGRRIVVGDEPVSALDAGQGAAVLARLAERHDTTVLALHDVAQALGHATRVLALRDGRIALDAPAGGVTARDLAPFYEP